MTQMSTRPSNKPNPLDLGVCQSLLSISVKTSIVTLKMRFIFRLDLYWHPTNKKARWGIPSQAFLCQSILLLICITPSTKSPAPTPQNPSVVQPAPPSSEYTPAVLPLSQAIHRFIPATSLEPPQNRDLYDSPDTTLQISPPPTPPAASCLNPVISAQSVPDVLHLTTGVAD